MKNSLIDRTPINQKEPPGGLLKGIGGFFSILTKPRQNSPTSKVVG
jgi:hypothetical protein